MITEFVLFNDVIKSRGSGSQGLSQSEWHDDGKYPVIGQGASYIEGWTNRDDLVIRPNPSLVLYGGHTRRAKFVDQPFVPGPNVKILEAKRKTQLDHKYIFYFLSELQVKSRGYADHFPEVKRSSIPIQPLDDQKRIAHLLGKVEGLIARRKHHLQQLDDLLKSVFLEMFGDPITNPRKFPARKLSEFYINPKEGTKCGPFGSALKKDELVDSGVPVWNMDNIDPTGRMVLPFRMWITEEKHKKLVSYSVIDGDIIISRAGTVGKMCVAQMNGEPAIISTNLIRLRLGDKLRPLHVVSLMTYCKGRVGRLKTGADGAFTHMNTGILDKLEFPYPPIDLQNQFAATVEKVEGIKSRYQKSLADLENLYGALSQKAFKGELDLSRVVLATEDTKGTEGLNREISERREILKAVDAGGIGMSESSIKQPIMEGGER